MSISINGSGAITFNDGSTQNTASLPGMRNRLINGAMMIDQRNAGASVTGNNGVYLTDRWRAGASQNSKFTGQQSTTAPSGYINSLLITSSSAYTVPAGETFTLAQFIEGLNISDFAWGTASASTVTLSFWVRSSLTGTFGGAIANSAVNRSYPFSYTISSANTWEQKTITVAGDTTGTWLTTNGIGIRVWLGLGVGADGSGTAGSWATADYRSCTGATSVVGTNGATFYITGVQLEKGSTATSFDYRPYGTELALCQRYYQVYPSFYVDIHLGSLGTATYTPYQSCLLTVPMRATPTMATTGFTILAGPTTATASITATSLSAFNTYVNKGANAWAAGSNSFYYTITATSEL